MNELKTLMHALSAERDDQKASFEAGLAHLDSATKTISELDAKLLPYLTTLRGRDWLEQANAVDTAEAR